MNEFPFTSDEWDAVRVATLALTNATLGDDAILRGDHFAGLQRAMSVLRGKYGDHPVLLETEADFCNDDEMRTGLYESALEIALRERLPCYTIRLELAQLWLQRKEFDVAREHLAAAKIEVLKSSDSSDRNRWLELQKALEEI